MSSVFSADSRKGEHCKASARARACEATATGLSAAIFIHRNVPVATTGTRATSSQRIDGLFPCVNVVAAPSEDAAMMTMTGARLSASQP